MDSSPLEPAPVVETVYPWVLRKIWSCLTSSPREPMVRFLVKVPVVGVVGDAGIVGGTKVVVAVVTYLCTALISFSLARVRGPTRPCDVGVTATELAVWKRLTAAIVAGP